MNIETHRPFLYIAGAFALGIFLSRFVPLVLGPLCLLTVFFLISGAAAPKRDLLPTAFLMIAITGLGIVYTKSRAYVPEEDIEYVARYYRKKPITIEGVIASAIQRREAFGRGKRTFTLDILKVEAKWGWQKRKGKVLVNIFGDADLFYGDRITLEGRLHRPYNFSSEKNFSYRDYLARRGIRFILSVKKDATIKVLDRGQGNYFKAASLTLRNRLEDVLSANLSRNEAGVMRAILLGDRSSIPKPVRALFVQTGTAHILAISGLHIGIVAALFLAFAKIMPVGRRGQLAAVIVLIAGYAFLTGARPSVLRAAVMTIVFLSSFIVEKEFDTLNTLGLAALAILLLNPLNLFDAGFQLSFSCVLAIIYADLRMRKAGLRRLRGETGILKPQRFAGWPYYVLQSLCLSLAIWVAVAGLIAYYFGIITPVTILANIVVVPLISVIVTLGFAVLAVGTLWPAWAFMFALCLKVALNIMIGLIFLFDKMPLAHIYIREIRIWHVIVYYVLLLAVVLIRWRRDWKRPLVNQTDTGSPFGVQS